MQGVGNGTTTNYTADGSYGFITSGTEYLWLYIPMNLKNMTVGSTLSVSLLKIGLRTVSGGYLGGADNFDVTNMVDWASFKTGQGILVMTIRNPNGWGVTNNTPVVGRCTITFTLTAG